MGRAFEVRKASMLKTSQAKSKVYSKYGKELYMVAKQGQPDPELNVALKKLIEKAKKDNVPADVIKRAIEKAKGGSDDSYTAVMYEGFGPNNSMIMVSCLTDNVNRTVSDVKNCFTKSKCKMGVSGSVQHMFSHQSLFGFAGSDADAIMEMLLENDCDIEDVEEDNGVITVTADQQNYGSVKSALEKNIADIKFEIDEVSWIPSTFVEISSEEDKANYEKLTSMLNELDDVNDIYHNIILK